LYVQLEVNHQMYPVEPTVSVIRYVFNPKFLCPCSFERGMLGLTRYP